MIQAYVNGPPGAGKTTLSKALAASLHLTHLATGDILRDHIKQRTELGKAAKKCIAAKTLVPDDIVVDMIADRALRAPRGYVLDGFPRTPEQTRLLKQRGISPNVVLLLEVRSAAWDVIVFKPMVAAARRDPYTAARAPR